ncbi:MAG: trypsin-like peptidase domain-containing protein [Acidimicrobiales bacterium]|nr:trypsin-like peptidase domain-containing protein [Acidimicrobiales bacterium]
MAVGFAAGMALSAALVGGGVLIGTQINDDPVVIEQADTPTTIAARAESRTDLTPATTPPPGVGDNPDVEPVTAVARALSPSVVLINTGMGQGSGIIWDAENGYIVTNDHVIGNAATVSVLFDDGAQVSGVVVGGDSARDIAVVQVDPEGLDLVEAVFAPTETVVVGQLAVAIGSPFGLDQSVTAGIVSAVNRINQFGGSDPSNPVTVEMIQTDAPINPGNSGGALANKDGHVIGMNTSIRTDGVATANVGVGFAVPSDTILIIAERIVDGESLELGFLGINGATPTDGTFGALVSLVVDGSPADDAGLKVGDLIIGVNGELVTTMEQLSADFKFFRPGDEIEIEVVREGERVMLQVTVGSN